MACEVDRRTQGCDPIAITGAETEGLAGREDVDSRVAALIKSVTGRGELSFHVEKRWRGARRLAISRTSEPFAEPIGGGARNQSSFIIAKALR